MDNIANTFNRSLLVLYALFHHYTNRQCRDSKNILLIFQQAFGNSIIFSSTLHEYTKLFPKADGYTVKILAQPSVLRCMQSNLILPKEEAIMNLIKKYQGIIEHESGYCITTI